jgi:SAM-dependent methyltransferase
MNDDFAASQLFAVSQLAAWSSPPVDDVGYIPSSHLCDLPDDDLRAIMDTTRITRYHGWRNHDGRWRDLMGLDELAGKDIIDWGCGTGIEALELAEHGNRLTVADIAENNVALAGRVLELYGMTARQVTLGVLPPFFDNHDGQFDVFYCNGVLHHIPWPMAVMQRAYELLRPDGEARIMMYSDKGWRLATGTEPPEQVIFHPKRQQFIRFFDEVGSWADWYDKQRLEDWFGEWFTVERFSYLTPDDRYCAAVLRRR